MEQYLRQIINTLDCVEVRGRENMDHLLGAILALESLIEQINSQSEPKDPAESPAEEICDG